MITKIEKLALFKQWLIKNVLFKNLTFTDLEWFLLLRVHPRKRIPTKVMTTMERYV
jgi:hypothetical protein